MSANQAEPVVKEYAEAAKVYDKKWSFYVNATTLETMSRLRVARSDRVLDVGCGTGELLARLAAKYPAAHLSGLDPVPEMLEVAREKLSERVELRVGWANELPWPEASFDLVVSCNMFHYITHPVAAVQEMERVLRPGGHLVITDWCDDYLACRVCNLYLQNQLALGTNDGHRGKASFTLGVLRRPLFCGCRCCTMCIMLNKTPFPA